MKNNNGGELSHDCYTRCGWVIWAKFWNSKNDYTNPFAFTNYIAKDDGDFGCCVWYDIPKIFRFKKDAEDWLIHNKQRLESNVDRLNTRKDWWPDTFRYKIARSSFQVSLMEEHK